jgi:hypothetical protein
VRRFACGDRLCRLARVEQPDSGPDEQDDYQPDQPEH